MSDWLVVILSAPLASFADSPGNAVRRSGDMPTRSALIGLAGAVLGVERADAAGQAALARALVTAAALHDPGHPLEDFHTFQSLHQAAKGARTRAEALAKAHHLETSITLRNYRSDALWQAAYRLSDAPGTLTLDGLAQAFRRPVFAPYIGRRSCPVAHPFNPVIVRHNDVRDAFADHADRTPTPRYNGRRAHEYSLEDRVDAPGANQASHRLRRDDPRDRAIRWTFGERDEWRLGPVTAGDNRT